MCRRSQSDCVSDCGKKRKDQSNLIEAMGVPALDVRWRSQCQRSEHHHAKHGWPRKPHEVNEAICSGAHDILSSVGDAGSHCTGEGLKRGMELGEFAGGTENGLLSIGVGINRRTESANLRSRNFSCWKRIGSPRASPWHWPDQPRPGQSRWR